MENDINVERENYWGFGLLPSCGILGNRGHDVSETGSVSETLCPLLPKIPEDGKSRRTQ
jgi:hypothetical protein